MAQGRVSLKRFRSASNKFIGITILAFYARLSAMAERREVVAQLEPERQARPVLCRERQAVQQDRARASPEVRSQRARQVAPQGQAANLPAATRATSSSAPCW